ncbi:hypothetical protein [Ensifer aridi]|nr:hypothetical protein [Ensifer aridi]
MLSSALWDLRQDHLDPVTLGDKRPELLGNLIGIDDGVPRVRLDAN